MSDVPIFYNLQNTGDVTAITGRLSDLETTVNTNLVAAINEIDGKFPVSIANGGTGATTATDARTNLGGVLSRTELFANSSGAGGTIYLSDDYTNYSYIYVQFMDNDVFNDATLYRGHGNQLVITNWYAFSDGEGMYAHTALLTFSGTTVTRKRSGTYILRNTTNNSWNASASAILITQIVGLK